MVAEVAVRSHALVGSAKPRIAPPMPARSDYKTLVGVAAELGITFMPWQVTSARYTEALAPDGRHLYQEHCELVGRQNGKSEKLVPLIVSRLRKGRRIMHTAQDRDEPRKVFGRVADIIGQERGMFRERNGRPMRPRFANGQEEIELANGGRYKIVAPTRSGARGDTNDDVIVDEVREMDSFEFIGAAKPTMTTSPDPQTIYLSNAGEADSIVLNSIRDRAGKDPRLAYLEWSADPAYADDDPRGWAQANPALGHIPTMYEYLSGEFLSYKLSGTLEIFRVEHLCRWVASTRQALVSQAAWNLGEVDGLPEPIRPVLGVSMDPNGRRASAALAWKQPDDTIALRMLFDVPGHPIDTDRLGKDIAERANELRVTAAGFDPLTDAQLAKFLRRSEPLTGRLYANASARFVNLIDAGKLKWHDAHAVGADLTWTARKPHDESGSFQAVRADDERPITAALAAIRAVWLASSPRPATGKPVPSAAGF